MESFAKKPSLSVETQRIAGYSHMRETLNLLCFGVLLWDSVLMGAFGSCVATFIIDLHARAHLRLDYHIYVSLWTRPHCLRFSLFFIVLFNSFCRKRSPNLVCMTAGVKHIHSHSLLNRSWQLLESLCYCQPTRNNLHSFRSCIFNV